MKRAKRPYEGTDAYEAGKKDAIKDLYDELENIADSLITNKDDMMEYLKLRMYLDDAKGE